MKKHRITRRDFLKTGALAASAGGLTAAVAGAAAARPPGRSEDLVLVNGRIHTMDDRNRIVDSVAVRNGRFSSVGRDSGSHGGRRIDLRGHTVVPGLVESHTHFVSLANRPGYHVATLELASNIREVQEALAARRRDVPSEQFITAMGGFHSRQWTEQRLPNLDELNAAVPDRPVFLFQGFNGPASTNTLGKTFFENVTSPLAGPVVVGSDGSITTIAGVNHATRALYHLRVRQSFEDKKRSTLDAMAFSAKVGVTALLDETLVAIAFGPREPQPTHFLANLDHYRMYDPWLALHRERRTSIRLQINFLHNQPFNAALGGLENQLPELRERLKNQFQFFGDDMLRTGAIGEWPAPFASRTGNPDAYAVWVEAQRLVAQARWRNENSPSNLAALQQVVEAYEALDAEFGIKELRWGVQHADGANQDLAQRLKNLNCGVSMSGFRWLQGMPGTTQVPPFRLLVDELGIQAGLHEDGVHIAPHNPWFALHFATTGLNVFGQRILPAGQEITRLEALRCYTRANAWFLNRENDLGSIEKGKLADLIVLDKDYFSVSDAQMRKIQPVLTIVGGNIVHDTGVLQVDKHADDDDDDD